MSTSTSQIEIEDLNSRALTDVHAHADMVEHLDLLRASNSPYDLQEDTGLDNSTQGLAKEL